MQIFLEKAILKNWGPFKNENEIEFSVDKDKPVTYVYGLNSSGKTHIFEAICWCLFDDPKIEELKEIVNKESLPSDEKEMFVRLKFFTVDDYENKLEYDIKRIIHFDITEDTHNGTLFPTLYPTMIKSDFVASRNSPLTNEHKLLNQSDFKKMIDNYIPSGPRRFFFLDGEKLATLFEKENLIKIESYANALSDVHLIDRLIENLDNLYNSLLSKQPQKKGDKLEIQQTSIKRATERYDSAINWKEEVSKRIFEAHGFEDSLRKECESFEELKPKIDLIKSLEIKKNNLEAERNQQFIGLKEFLNNNLPLFFIQTEFKWCLQELEVLDKKGKIPPKRTPPELLEIILADPEKKCICGREITEEIRKDFLQIQKIIPDKEFNHLVQNFRSDITRTSNDVTDQNELLIQKLTSIKQKGININKLSNEITSERKFLPTGIEKDFDSINEKFKRWNSVKDEIRELRLDLERAETNILVTKKSVENERATLESLLKKDKKNERVGELIKFVRISQETAEDIKREVQKSIIAFVSENTSNEFKELIWDPQNWERVCIDEDWKINAITSNNFTIQSDRLSQGQRHVLGIAFMSSLGKVTGNYIPFIFDSPFGRVSQEPIENIGKNLTKLMEGRQVVLFVTDTEDPSIKPHIKNIIGFTYIINKISATESVIEVNKC